VAMGRSKTNLTNTVQLTDPKILKLQCWVWC